MGTGRRRRPGGVLRGRRGDRADRLAAAGPWQNALVPSLIAFIPLWMLAAIWAFSFRTGLRAWAVMSATAVAGFGLLWLLRLTGAVQ